MYTIKEIKVKNIASALRMSSKDKLFIRSEPQFPHQQVGLNNYSNCLAMSTEQGNVHQDNNNLFLNVYEQMLFLGPSFLSEAHRARFIFNSEILNF